VWRKQGYPNKYNDFFIKYWNLFEHLYPNSYERNVSLKIPKNGVIKKPNNRVIKKPNTWKKRYTVDPLCGSKTECNLRYSRACGSIRIILIEGCC
jgi:hypothetical protein